MGEIKGIPMRETPLWVIQQGCVRLIKPAAYVLAESENTALIRFYPLGCTDVLMVSKTIDNIPSITMAPVGPDPCIETIIELSQYKGWQVHAIDDGLIVNIALIHPDALK